MTDSKDLWELGQVKGRQDERERIIAIIQNKARNTDAPARLLSELALILAEIKGETK